MFVCNKIGALLKRILIFVFIRITFSKTSLCCQLKCSWWGVSAEEHSSAQLQSGTDMPRVVVEVTVRCSSRTE